MSQSQYKVAHSEVVYCCHSVRRYRFDEFTRCRISHFTYSHSHMLRKNCGILISVIAIEKRISLFPFISFCFAFLCCVISNSSRVIDTWAHFNNHTEKTRERETTELKWIEIAVIAFAFQCDLIRKNNCGKKGENCKCILEPNDEVNEIISEMKLWIFSFVTRKRMNEMNEMQT